MIPLSFSKHLDPKHLQYTVCRFSWLT